MSKKLRRAENGIPIASIHTHFNLFRNLHEAHEGDVTVAEQVKAIERFIRWHQRQVQVGEDLLKWLQAEAGPIAPPTDAPSEGDSER